MNTKFRTRWFNLTALMLVLSLVMPWAAFADELASGDSLTTLATGGSTLNLGNVGFGSTTSGSVFFAIERSGNGSAVFKEGSSPELTAGTPSSSAVSVTINTSGNTANDNKIAVPSNWSGQTTGTKTSDTARATINVSAVGATCGPKSATVVFTVSGLTNQNNPGNISRSTTVTINWNVVNCQVATSLSVNAASGTYGGTTSLSATLSPAVSGKTIAFSVNGSNVGSASTNTSGVATLSNVSLAGIDANTYASGVGASFAGDSTHLASSSTAILTVNKAAPTVSAAGGMFIYDGTAKPGSGVATGVGGAALSPVTLSYKQGTNNLSGAPVNAGTYTVVATFAGNSNYLPGSDEATITINRADQVIAWSNPAPITFGTALSDAQLNATLTTGDGELTYTPAAGAILGAGTRTLRVDAAQTDNYNAAFAEVEIVVNKANPVITWSNPDAITYGTPLSAAQLNASANVAGNFSYGTVAGTVLNAGTHTLSVTFTPNDTANYNSVTAEVEIVVNKANQVIAWSNPAAITYGTPLSVTQLNATLTTGNGELTYSHNIGDILDAGSHTLTVNAAATDNFNAASKSVTLTVNKATPTVTVTGGEYTYDGTARPATGTVTGVNSQLVASPSLTFTYNNLPDAPVNAGTYAVVGSFAGNNNYTSASGTATIVINKASATVTLGNLSHVYSGQAKAASATTNATGTSSFTFAYTQDGQSVTPINAGTYNVVATLVNDNYYGSATGTMTIAKADATINVQGKTVTYDGNAHGATGTATGVNGENLSSLLSLGDTFTNVPGGTASWSFAGNNNYNGANGTAAIVINKAATTTTVTCAEGPFTYTGSAQTPCSATVTGAGGLDESVAVTYANNIDAGQATASASYPGGDNHLASEGSKTFTIGKAATTTTVTCAAGPFSYTGSPITPCTATVTGPAGLSQSLPVNYSNNVKVGTATASASYAESANYLGSSDSKTFAIGAWRLEGFYQPIGTANSIVQGPTATGDVATAPSADQGTVWNTSKGGSTIPLKFRVFAGTEEKKLVSDVRSFTATKLNACTSGAGGDEVDFTTTGNTALRYDSTEGQFVQNWATPKVTADTCYRVAVTTQDNSVIYTFVRLRK